MTTPAKPSSFSLVCRMNPTLRSASLAIALACLAPTARAQEKLQYNRDVRPVLTDACFKCHGPAGRKGGFRLDERDEALKPARSKKAPIVPGQPEQSEIVRRIFATDADEVMPPPAAHKTLTAAQKERIK